MLHIEDLAKLWEAHGTKAPVQVREFSLRGTKFDFNSRPSIMGVINLSPDSWYRESVCLGTEQAIQRGHVLAAQGAEIIDIGAESTLAQATRADVDLQKSKLLPVVKTLAAHGLLISVETYQPAVARACLEAGAAVLNLTGTIETEEAYRIVADHQAAVIICYVQGANVRQVGNFSFEKDLIEQMYDFFARETEKANKAGVSGIFIDPGLGFYYANLQDSAKRIRHQMSVFLHAFRLRSIGFPICNALPHAFEFFGEEVRAAEPFFAVLAALGRTDLFRTHEVPKVRAVLDTLGVF